MDARTGAGVRGLPRIVQTLCEDLLTGDYGSGSMLGSVDDSALASLMAEVDEPALQRKVLRWRAPLPPDRHLADGEALVLAAARRHWCWARNPSRQPLRRRPEVA